MCDALFIPSCFRPDVNTDAESCSESHAKILINLIINQVDQSNPQTKVKSKYLSISLVMHIWRRKLNFHLANNSPRKWVFMGISYGFLEVEVGADDVISKQQSIWGDKVMRLNETTKTTMKSSFSLKYWHWLQWWWWQIISHFC